VPAPLFHWNAVKTGSEKLVCQTHSGCHPIRAPPVSLQEIFPIKILGQRFQQDGGESPPDTSEGRCCQLTESPGVAARARIRMRRSHYTYFTTLSSITYLLTRQAQPRAERIPADKDKKIRLRSPDRGQQPHTRPAILTTIHELLQHTLSHVDPVVHGVLSGTPTQLEVHDACAAASGATMDSITGRRREIPAARRKVRSICRREYWALAAGDPCRPPEAVYFRRSGGVRHQHHLVYVGHLKSRFYGLFHLCCFIRNFRLDARSISLIQRILYELEPEGSTS
jgi:hypothetical protein